LYNKDITAIHIIPPGKTTLSNMPQTLSGSVVIPSTVTIIAANAFSGGSAITEIEIPGNVTAIGAGAFSGCTGLQSIQLPFVGRSINSTDRFSYIFGTLNDYLPSSLHTVIITDAVRIRRGVFGNCKNIRNIILPAGVTNIESWAFSNCTALEQITLPYDLIAIADYTFYGCESLAYIEIPYSVVSIGASAFENCASLKNVRFATDRGTTALDSVGDYAFAGCASLTLITLPASVTSIGAGAFYGCESLTAITIPYGVTHLYDSVFQNCGSLVSFGIEGDLVYIGAAAFAGCTALENFTLENGFSSLEYIGEYAFYYCSNLSGVFLGGIYGYEFLSDSEPAHEILFYSWGGLYYFAFESPAIGHTFSPYLTISGIGTSYYKTGGGGYYEFSFGLYMPQGWYSVEFWADTWLSSSGIILRVRADSQTPVFGRAEWVGPLPSPQPIWCSFDTPVSYGAGLRMEVYYSQNNGVLIHAATLYGSAVPHGLFTNPWIETACRQSVFWLQMIDYDTVQTFAMSLSPNGFRYAWTVYIYEA
jgi:hypothetical protein